MRRGYIKWDKLDNTANLFPVIAGERMTNTYRISAVLTEEIQPELLQEALDIITPKFPGFNLRLRKGVFWYYFEENGKKSPRVKLENTYPCRLIHQSRNNSYMFRVTYYGKRINLEVFHVLTDGMGGISFLRELTYQYIRLAHPALQQQLGDRLSCDTSLNREDSFIKNYRNPQKSVYVTKRAFPIRGERLPHNGLGAVIALMPLGELKAAAKSYGVSINEYLVGAFIWACYREYGMRITPAHPLRVAVPVNLRPFFESTTTKNFFVMIAAEFIPEDREYTFAEILTLTRESLHSQINKEHLEQIFSYNVSNERNLIARGVPLFMKNIAIKLVYTKNALANSTTITNIGQITVDEPYMPYIENIYSMLGPSKGQGLKATISSFNGQVAYVFTSTWQETSILRRVFSQITKDSVTVTVETNGVFYG